jgi:hypothetical protein
MYATHTVLHSAGIVSHGDGGASKPDPSSLPEPDPSSSVESSEGHAESTPLAPGPVVQYETITAAHSAVDSPPSCDRRRPEAHIAMHAETSNWQEAHIAMHAWTVQGVDPWR